MNVPTKFEVRIALPVPEIIGCTEKNWTAPGYAHAPFSPNFLWAFIRIGPVNVLAKFELRSFTRSRGVATGGISVFIPPQKNQPK